MSDTMSLCRTSICVQYHDALAVACLICGAKAEEPCVDEGKLLPMHAAHIGRQTGGVDLVVEHTGEYNEDGSARLRELSN
jgi:hypothetical protein